MSDFERDYEIVYHWSPRTRYEAIVSEGLRVGAVPCVNAVEGPDRRNSYIATSPTPQQAWWLSAQALVEYGFDVESQCWDLYEVDIKGLPTRRRSDDFPEVKVDCDIPADRVTWVASRWAHDNGVDTADSGDLESSHRHGE